MPPWILGAARALGGGRAVVQQPAQGRVTLTPGRGGAPRSSVRADSAGPTGAPRRAWGVPIEYVVDYRVWS
eukprot:5343745-Alexandrium_andersonii.AAC.1